MCVFVFVCVFVCVCFHQALLRLILMAWAVRNPRVLLGVVDFLQELFRAPAEPSGSTAAWLAQRFGQAHEN